MASSPSSSPAGPAEADSPIVHVAFSSGASHFVACTATGFHVFSCNEKLERVRSKSTAVVPAGVEVTSAEMLTPSRVAFVTRNTGLVDGAAEHEAIYFFDEESKRTIRISSAKTPGLGLVGGLRLVGDHAIIAGQEMAMLVVRGDIKNSELVATGPNPMGLCALAVDRRAAAFAYALPRPEKGAVQVCRSGQPGSVDVRAHASSLSCIALSRDGRMLATAGSKGTLVRIFSTDDGTKLQELRRGIHRADIHCIAFSPDSTWLAVSSGKGTVHVFPVDKATSTTEGGDGDALPAPPAATASPPAPATAKQGSSLPSFFKGYLPSYFSSEWSLARTRLPEGVKYTVEFWRQDPNVILVAGTDGSFYRCRFNLTNAGEMKQLDCKRFM